MPKPPAEPAHAPLIDPASQTHPEEIRFEAEISLPGKSSLRVAARITPAGLVCAGLLVAAALLSSAVLARALRPASD